MLVVLCMYAYFYCKAVEGFFYFDERLPDDYKTNECETTQSCSISPKYCNVSAVDCH